MFGGTLGTYLLTWTWRHNNVESGWKPGMWRKGRGLRQRRLLSALGDNKFLTIKTLLFLSAEERIQMPKNQRFARKVYRVPKSQEEAKDTLGKDYRWEPPLPFPEKKLNCAWQIFIRDDWGQYEPHLFRDKVSSQFTKKTCILTKWFPIFHKLLQVCKVLVNRAVAALSR